MQNSSLRELVKKRKFLRIIEVHNGLSALIAQQISVARKNGKMLSFDGFWESSLTDSASKGQPDTEIVSLNSRVETINQIRCVTNKPLIVDGDTGGNFTNFEHMVKHFGESGVAAVIIEDKVFPKKNSFIDSIHTLENTKVFVEKLKRGIALRENPDFMIIARLEGLIAGHPMEETLDRAKIFLQAGADGIMIHSKKSGPKEILKFASLYKGLPKKLTKRKVLVCAPTTYNKITATDLAKNGFNIIIYANHLLRSSYKAMEKACETILLNDRSFEAEHLCINFKDLFKIVRPKNKYKFL